MKNFKKYISIFLVSLVLSSCSNAFVTTDQADMVQYETTGDLSTRDIQTGIEEKSDLSSIEAADTVLDEDYTISKDSSRKIEKFYDYLIETIDYDKDYDKIMDSIKTCDGYVDSSNLNIDRGINNDENLRYYNASIKIPVENSDNFAKILETIGKLKNVSNYSNDLTKSFKDAGMVLKSKEKELDKLNELMDAADNIDDTMAIQARILEVESEIDSIKSNIRDLEDRVDYNTFNVSLSEVYDYNAYGNTNPDFLSRIANAFKDSIHIFTKFIGDLIVSIVSLWPLIILGIIVGYFVSKKIKHSDKKN